GAGGVADRLDGRHRRPPRHPDRRLHAVVRQRARADPLLMSRRAGTRAPNGLKTEPRREVARRARSEEEEYCTYCDDERRSHARKSASWRPIQTVRCSSSGLRRAARALATALAAAAIAF